MAFFLESTFVGLFFFGWDRLGKVQHMAVTWLVALGSNPVSYTHLDVYKRQVPGRAAQPGRMVLQPASLP